MSSAQEKDPSSTTALHELPPNDEARPAVFSSTVQEILFVAVATMAIAMSSLLTGSVTVLTSQVQRDLGMTTAELTWLAGSSSCAIPHFLPYVPSPIRVSNYEQSLGSPVAPFSSASAAWQTCLAARPSFSAASSSMLSSLWVPDFPRSPCNWTC